MESSSDISSISSQPEMAHEVPAINIQEFILQQHARNLSSLQDSRAAPSRPKFPKIFTVAQTLKDPLILNHIKPDYGSLEEFIGDINISKDLLSQKKRKNESSEDDIEEKRTRVMLREKTQEELNKIYLSKDSTALSKRVAGKLLVENIFKDSFGVTLTTFEMQNTKPEQPRSQKINLANIDQIFTGKKSCFVKNQSTYDRKTNGLKEAQQETPKAKVRQKNTKNWTRGQRMEALRGIKSKYASLRQLEFRRQCPEYDKIMGREENTEQQQFGTKKEQPGQKPKQAGILQFTEVALHMERITIKPELVLYLLSEFKTQALQKVSLSHVRIAEEVLCFLFQAVGSLCQDLSSVSLKAISLERTENLAYKIKWLLQTLPLRQLFLEYMDLETKEFCVICLGIGSNLTLEEFGYDHNGIDERACKSLELICKHCPKLRRVSVRHNYLQPHHLAHFPAESRAKILL